MSDNSQGIMKQDDQSLTLAQRLKLKKSQATLLLDVSGSMAEEIEPSRTKIDALRDVVRQLKGDPKIVAFESRVHNVPDKNSVPSPMGGTNLYGALIHLRAQGVKNVILLTDGEAEAQDDCLAIAKEFKIKVMYIGLGNRPDFLDKLALASDGYATTEDLLNPKELTEKLTLLLESGNQDRTIIL